MYHYQKRLWFLLLAFWKYRCNFRKYKPKNLKPSMWSDLSELILILHRERIFHCDLPWGGCFHPMEWFASWFCKTLFIRSPATCFLVAAFVALSTALSEGSSVSQLAEGVGQDSYVLLRWLTRVWPKNCCQLLSRSQGEYFITLEGTALKEILRLPDYWVSCAQAKCAWPA